MRSPGSPCFEAGRSPPGDLLSGYAILNERLATGRKAVDRLAGHGVGDGRHRPAGAVLGAGPRRDPLGEAAAAPPSAASRGAGRGVATPGAFFGGHPAGAAGAASRKEYSLPVPVRFWRWLIALGAEALGALLVAVLLGDDDDRTDRR